MAVLYGAGWAGLAGPGGALGRALASYFGERDLEPALAAHLREAVDLVPVLAAFVRGSASGDRQGPPQEALRSALASLFSSLAERHVVVCVVEDLHFASPDMRRLLVGLAQDTRDRRVLLVATTRPGLPTEELAAVDGVATARKTVLARMDRDETAELVSGAVGGEVVAPAVRDAIVARSAGNPLFALELTVEMREREGRRGRGAGVPESIRELLLSRLSGLSAAQKELLEVGAAQGSRFDPGRSARGMGRPELEVLHHLAQIQRQVGIIHPAGKEVEFDHHLLQELVYEALPDALRVEYHARLASAHEAFLQQAAYGLERVSDEDALFLVQHYVRSDQGERAAPFLLRGLRCLSLRWEHEALVETGNRALAALRSGWPALRCDVRLAQAPSLGALGRLDDQLDALRDATALAAEAGDDVRRARAMSELGYGLIGEASYAEACDVLDRALAIASAAGDRAGEALACRYLGRAQSILGRYGEALANARRALELFTILDDRNASGLVRANVAEVLCQTGDYAGALRELELALAIFRNTRDRLDESITLSSVAATYVELGRYEEARSTYLECIRLTREAGSRRGESFRRANLARVHINLGDLAAARRDAEAALAFARGLYRQLERGVCVSLAIIMLLEGRLEDAERRLSEARALSRGSGPGYQAEVLVLQGQVLHAAGSLLPARECIAEAIVRYRAAGERGYLATALTAMGALRLDLGEVEPARVALAEAADLVEATARAEPGCLPAAYLALLGHGAAESVTVGERSPLHVRAEAHLVLHRAGGGPEHLRAARMSIERIGAHLSGPDAAVFWSRNAVARGIVEAERRAGRGEDERRPR